MPISTPHILRMPTITSIFLVALTALFACNNLYVAEFFAEGPERAPAWCGLVFGICFAQLNLIAIWAAVSVGPWIVRLPWAFLLVELMWLSIIWGNSVHENPLMKGETLTLGVVLLICCLVAQCPLWIAGRVYGWQLVPPQHAIQSQRGGQFSIGQMLLGTIVLAVSLAIARRVFFSQRGDLEFRLDMQMLPVLCVVTIVNLITVVPAIWSAFFSRFSFGKLFAWIAVAIGITVMEMIFFAVVLGLSSDRYFWFAFQVINFSQIGAVYYVLLVLKAIGFRFERQ